MRPNYQLLWLQGQKDRVVLDLIERPAWVVAHAFKVILDCSGGNGGQELLDRLYEASQEAQDEIAAEIEREDDERMFKVYYGGRR